MAVVNGLVGQHPVDRVPALNPAPYPLTLDIRLGETRLSTAGERSQFDRQELDFGAAELRSRFLLRSEREIATVEVVTFASRVLPTIVAQETTVTLDESSDIELSAAIDPAGVPGSWAVREQPPVGTGEPAPDGLMSWRSLDDDSRCGLAYYSSLVGASGVRRTTADHERQQPLVTTYQFHARAGRPYRLVQIASVVPSVMHGQPERQAMRLAHQAFERGFERLREEHGRAWRELWRSRLIVAASDGPRQHRRVRHGSPVWLHRRGG